MIYVILTLCLLLAFGASVLLKLYGDARYRRRQAVARRQVRRESAYDEEYYLPGAREDSAPMPLQRFLLYSGLVTLALGALGFYLFRPAHWRIYTASDSAYAVDLPDAPSTSTRTLSTPAGSVTINTVAVNRLFRVSCSVEYVDLAAVRSDLMSQLSEQMDSAIAGRSQAKELKKTAITTDGNPGVELLLRDPRDGLLRIRVYTVSSRLYTVTAAGLHGE